MTPAIYQINNQQERNAVVAWENIISLKKSNQLQEFFLWLNNDIYDTVTWNQPPLESIAFYEQQHASTLRQQYDYIRVWYSGGSDSHSVVESFLRADQSIDEIGIVFWKTVLPTIETSGDGNQPLVLGWLTDLYQKYQKPLPKISIVNIDKSDVDNHFQARDYFRNHVGYAGNFSFNLNHYAEIAKLAPKPTVQNYAEIFGLEKPRIVFENNQAYFQMNDKQVMHAASDDTPIEWFYLPRQTPDLIRAQLWNIINYTQIHHAHDAGTFIQQLQTNKEFYNTWCVLCGRTSTPKQNTLAIQSKNLTGTSLTPAKWKKYTHIEQSCQDKDQSWNNYREFVNYTQELKQYWDANEPSLPGVLTKRYFLSNL